MLSTSRIWSTLIALVAIAATALAVACGDDKGGQPGASSDQLAPVQELRLNLTGEPQTLDPNLAADGLSIELCASSTAPPCL
jgi:ABC-type oligopeptide transport system substrate-binding subunit